MSMGSFGKRKKLALRLGVPLLVLASILSQGVVASAQSYPNTDPPGTTILLTRVLDVTENATGYYTVTADRKTSITNKEGLDATTGLNSTQKSDIDGLESNHLEFDFETASRIPATGLPDGTYYMSKHFLAGDLKAYCSSSDQNIRNKAVFSVSYKAAPGQGSAGIGPVSRDYDMCAEGGQAQKVNLFDAHGAIAGGNASVSGTITNVAPSGAVTPYGQGSVITITNKKTNEQKHLDLSDGTGVYSLGGLDPGDWTLHAEWTPGGSTNKMTIDKDFTLVAGVNSFNFTSTVEYTGCSDGKAPDANGECAETELDCGAGAINWFVCIVIDSAKNGAGVIDGMIMDSLNTDVKEVFDTNTSGGAQNGYYTAWNSFRILATAMLVVGGLVMVISQALGFEFLDAYTVRKVLPRLLIATIGISLSWPIMRFVVQFFDTLGFDIRNLIYAPFSHLGGTINLTTGIFTWLGAGAAIFLLGPATLSFLVTGFFALLIGFVIIVFRELAILVLIILAPMAIAFYILPNTQKLWKLWYDNFLGLMLVFPIISALIATGHVFSAVSIAKNGSVVNSTLAQAVGLLAYFIPYFILPLAFRLATGVIGTIAGFANDKGRGIFDSQKKKRQAAMQDRLGRARSESLYSNATKRGRYANKAASWLTAPGANIAYAGRNKIPGLKRAGQKIAGQVEHARVEQSGKLFEELNKMGYNDKAYRLLSGQHSKLSQGTQAKLSAAGLLNRAPTSLSDIQKVADIMSQSDVATEKIGANAIHGSAGRLASLYQDPEMGKADIGAAGIMGLAAHGFASSADIAGSANLLMGGKHENAGYAQAIAAQAQVLGGRHRPDAKAGYGVVYKDGKFIDGMSDEGGRMGAVLDTYTSADLAGAKGDAIKTVRPEIERRLAGSKGEQFKTAQKDQLFSWAGPYSQASADVKAQALDIIYEKDEAGAYKRDQLVKDFEKYTRADLGDPTRLGGSPPREEPPQPPGG